MAITKILQTQIEKTQKKFETFDRWIEEKKPALVYLKSDPTLFSYFMFKNPINPKEPLKPYPFQDMILNDKHKRVILVIARQTGKSMTAALDALSTAFWNPNSLVLVISATKDQAKELIHRMRQLLIHSNLKWKEKGSKESKSEIVLKDESGSESRIISVPATDAARGYSPDVVILDEADFIEQGEYFFKHVVLPMVQATKGKIKIYTTPNPHKRAGFVFECFNSKYWSAYQFDWRANPNISEEEIDQIKNMEMMSDAEFTCEYLAQFPTTEHSFFKESLIREAQDENAGEGGTLPFGANLVMGVDLGKVHDKSVIYIGYIENPMDEFNKQIIRVWRRILVPLGTDYSSVLAEIRNLVSTYGINRVIIDSTSEKTIGDVLTKDGINVEPVVFSLQSKADIYGNLQLFFEKKRIKIPKERELFNQLVMMEHEYIGYNKLKIHHPEHGKDDEPDALALMVWGLSRIISPPVSLTIV